MAYPNEKKDRNEAVRQMKRDGYTIREIAQAFGISYQRVSHLCAGMTYDSKSHFKNSAVEKCIYPNIRNYLTENRITIAELTRRMYGNCNPTNQNNVRKYLKGKGDLTKPTIDRLLKATGLTYEVAFAEVEKGE